MQNPLLLGYFWPALATLLLLLCGGIGTTIFYLMHRDNKRLINDSK